MIQYLIEGFRLLVKRLNLYLIGLLFWIVEALLNNYLLQNRVWFIQIISYFVLYLGFVYAILVPKFLTEKPQGVSGLVSRITPQILEHAKRLIIPSLVFMFFFIVLIVFLMFAGVFIISATGSVSNLEDTFKALGTYMTQPFSPFYLIIGIFFLPLTFFSIYYAGEGLGVMASLRKSVKVSFQHIKFASILIILNFILTSLIFYLPQQSLWSQFIKLICGGFVNMWLYSASVLVYYQKVVKNLR